MIVAHIDDEILWFLPWLAHMDKIIIASLPATSAHLNIVSKYSSQYDALWHWGRGMTSIQDYKERWLDQTIRQDLITDWNYDRMLRDIIADPEVDEIWTHNSWGCYGHLHHQQVSEAVRKLACEYGKDVWCPNIIVTFPAGGQSHSVYDSASLPYFHKRMGYFDAGTFRQFRQYYLDEPINQTFPLDYWTWGGPKDYPRGSQKYFLAVTNGHDMTEEDSEIQWLKDSLPIYGI